MCFLSPHHLLITFSGNPLNQLAVCLCRCLMPRPLCARSKPISNPVVRMMLVIAIGSLDPHPAKLRQAACVSRALSGEKKPPPIAGNTISLRKKATPHRLMFGRTLGINYCFLTPPREEKKAALSISRNARTTVWNSGTAPSLQSCAEELGAGLFDVAFNSFHSQAKVRTGAEEPNGFRQHRKGVAAETSSSRNVVPWAALTAMA